MITEKEGDFIDGSIRESPSEVELWLYIPKLLMSILERIVLTML